jgi:hypothetical protein
MYTVDQLRVLARAYIDATGIAPSALSRAITGAGNSRFGNSAVIPRLLAGKSCVMEHGEMASRWFEQNWPDDLPWPWSGDHSGCSSCSSV